MTLTRRLVWTALGSAVLSAGCLGGAYTLASARDSGSNEIVTREIAWDGNDTLIADLPSETRYVQSPGPGRIVARGPHRSLSTLSVADGRIHDALLHTGAVIELDVTAPNITRFTLGGRSRLAIHAYDQSKLSVTAQGDAEIVVSGRAGDVDIAMQGGSTLNLAALTSQSLRADIAGDGVLIVASTQNADLVVRNRASVILLSRPQQLTTKVEDEGRVIDAAQVP